MRNSIYLLVLFCFIISCKENKINDQYLYSRFTLNGSINYPESIYKLHDTIRDLYQNGITRLVLRKDSFDIPFKKKEHITDIQFVESQIKYENNVELYNRTESKYRDSLYQRVSFNVDSVKLIYNNTTEKSSIVCIGSLFNERQFDIETVLYSYIIRKKYEADCSDDNHIYTNSGFLSKYGNENIVLQHSVKENEVHSNYVVYVSTLSIKYKDNYTITTLFPFDSLRSYDFDLSDYDIKYDTIWKRRY